MLPWLVKGTDLPRRAAKMRAAFGRHPVGGLWVEVDFERFDAHVDVMILEEVEHEVYYTLFDADDPWIRELLSIQLRTNAYHVAGVTYRCIGRRCSGDPNTSIGNSLINRFLHWLAFREEVMWASFHEGDDCLAWFEVCGETDRARLTQRLLDTAATLGFAVKVVCSENPEETVFCGRVNYVGRDGLSTAADLPRAMNKFHVTTANLPTQAPSRVAAKRSLLLGKAMSYYVTDRDTPVLGWLCYSIIRLLRGVKPRFEDTWKMHQLGNLDAVDFSVPPNVDVALRVAFDMRYDLRIQAQESLEAEYRGWVAAGAIPLDPPLMICQGAADHIVDDTKYFVVQQDY